MSALDTIRADVAKVAALIEPAFAALAVVQAATGIGGATAAEVLTVIDSALKVLEDAARGVATKEQALASLAELRASLAANDAAADAALRARFPPATP